MTITLDITKLLQWYYNEGQQLALPFATRLTKLLEIQKHSLTELVKLEADRWMVSCRRQLYADFLQSDVKAI